MLAQLQCFMKLVEPMRKLILFAGFASAIVVSAAAAGLPAQLNADPAAVARWQSNRFGMFIHFDPAVLTGKEISWSRAGERRDRDEHPTNGTPASEYDALYHQFNPTNFDAHAWVKTAKETGMKYIVFTAKHHDGFAMYRSKVNPYNAVDATPWHHDPIADLARECRRQGIQLCFYYSQDLDWHHPDGAWNDWDYAKSKKNPDRYLREKVLPQLTELLTNYGPDVPAVIWWDTPIDMNPERAGKIYDTVEKLRPDIIMNNRLGGGYKGDYVTPEQKIPAKGFPGQDWETCMTINNTWGYKRDDHNWKSAQTLIRNLCDIASKGGNYLLNVGPDSTGIIPQPEVERLEAIGKWMQVNGEAIYGSSATCFGEELGKPVKAKDGYGRETMVSSADDWRCTTKPGKIYIIIFKWPATGKFELPGLESKVTKASLLAGHKTVEFDQTSSGVTISLPAEAPDKIASVICIQIADKTPRVAVKK